jgi:hypothetical protein
MKTGRFLQKELIYSTLETYFIQEELGEHQAPTDVAANEVTNYPSSVNLINVKESGRTGKGLGIGF